MVILMPRKRRAPSKGLLAVGIRALVRTLAGVDTAVPSQRAAVREGLDLLA